MKFTWTISRNFKVRKTARVVATVIPSNYTLQTVSFHGAFKKAVTHTHSVS